MSRARWRLLSLTLMAAQTTRASVDVTAELVEAHLSQRLVGVPASDVPELARVVVERARGIGMDPWLVVAVMEVESSYRAGARSPAGAVGLMQVMPRTFREVSSYARITDPIHNVVAGIAYLGRIQAMGFRRLESILRAYNGGPRTANQYSKALQAGEAVDAFPDEMVQYPTKVLKRYKRLTRAAQSKKVFLEAVCRSNVWPRGTLPTHIFDTPTSFSTAGGRLFWRTRRSANVVVGEWTGWRETGTTASILTSKHTTKNSFGAGTTVCSPEIQSTISATSTWERSKAQSTSSTG